MKIKLDLDEIEVPKEIELAFKEAKEKRKNSSGWNGPLEDDDFYDWVGEYVYDLEYDGKIVDKELAIFIVNMVTKDIPFEGGYPIENWMDFEAGDGYYYYVCAFDWTISCEDGKGRLQMIGYKEKIRSIK